MCVIHLEKQYEVNVEMRRMYFSVHPSLLFEKVILALCLFYNLYA